MTLDQINANFARLRTEIDALANDDHSEARVARLICELDQVDRELVAFKHLAMTAPVLRDAVPRGYRTGFGASTA
jgi:hypothetical protein